jgi:hypothetical protein
MVKIFSRRAPEILAALAVIRFSCCRYNRFIPDRILGNDGQAVRLGKSCGRFAE